MRRVGRSRTEPEIGITELRDIANVHLYLASVNGNYETAEAALERGANVNFLYTGPSKDPTNLGRSKVELIVSFIEFDKYLTLTFLKDDTPLHCATESCNEPLVRLLLLNNADPNRVSKY